MWTSQGVHTLKIGIFTKKNEDETFQYSVFIQNTLEKFIKLYDVLNSVYVEVFTKKPVCNVLKEVVATFISLSFFFPFGIRCIGILKILETFFQVKTKSGILSDCAYKTQKFAQKKH